MSGHSCAACEKLDKYEKQVMDSMHKSLQPYWEPTYERAATPTFQQSVDELFERSECVTHRKLFAWLVATPAIPQLVWKRQRALKLVRTVVGGPQHASHFGTYCKAALLLHGALNDIRGCGQRCAVV